MSTLFALLHRDLPSGASVYTTTIAVIALTAVFARSPGRRRTAREVLKILLFRTATRWRTK